MCNHAEDADLPRRVGDPGRPALSASAAAAAASAAADGQLSGRIAGPGGRDLPDPATAAAASTAGAPFRRTRLKINGRRESAGRPRQTP
jgi:hypothetical protein